MNEVLCPTCGSAQIYLGGIHVVMCIKCHRVSMRSSSTDNEIREALDGSIIKTNWADEDVTYEEWRDAVIEERHRLAPAFGVWN